MSCSADRRDGGNLREDASKQEKNSSTYAVWRAFSTVRQNTSFQFPSRMTHWIPKRPRLKARFKLAGVRSMQATREVPLYSRRIAQTLSKFGVSSTSTSNTATLEFSFSIADAKSAHDFVRTSALNRLSRAIGI